MQNVLKRQTLTNSTAKSDKSLRSFSAVFPLQLVDIDQTYDILCLCSTEISQQKHVNSEQKGSRRLFVQNIPPEMFFDDKF